MKRWARVMAGLGLILLILGICLPGALIRYLNRPDTDFRKSVSDHCSRALGEPVTLNFTISRARLSPRLMLSVHLTGIEFRAETAGKLRMSIESVRVEIPVVRWLLDNSPSFHRVEIHIPHLSLERGPDGTWPFQKALDQKSKNQAAAKDEPMTAKPRESRLGRIVVIVDRLRIKWKSTWEEIADLHADLRHDPSKPEYRLEISAARFNSSQIPLGIAAAAQNLSGPWVGSVDAGPVTLDALLPHLRRLTVGDLGAATGRLRASISGVLPVDTDLPVGLWIRMEQFRSAISGRPVDFPVLIVSGQIAFPKDGLVRFENILAGTGADTVHLDGQIAGSAVTGRIQGRLFGGDLDGRFSGPLTFSSMDVSGRLAHADLSRINSHLGKSNIRLTGTADATADLKNVSSRVSRISGTMNLSARAVTVDGLPTFSQLSASLNEIIESIRKIGEGDVMTQVVGKMTATARGAIAQRGTTAFDQIEFAARCVNGVAHATDIRLDNADIRIRGGGTVDLTDGALQMTATILLKEPALKNVQSRFAREILSKEIVLPIHGTLMDPVFDKESVLKPLLRETGRKVIEEKLGDFLLKKLGKPR